MSDGECGYMCGCIVSLGRPRSDQLEDVFHPSHYTGDLTTRLTEFHQQGFFIGCHFVGCHLIMST